MPDTLKLISIDVKSEIRAPLLSAIDVKKEPGYLVLAGVDIVPLDLKLDLLLKNLNNTPVVGASVKIYFEDELYIDEMSDGDGKVEREIIPNREYRMEIKHERYTDYVDIFFLRGSIFWEITLRKINKLFIDTEGNLLVNSKPYDGENNNVG